ncbi:VWA domain-containing protein [Nocardiopsis sediminis]|uniref:VWA domain-containing protein n=1 Tax=Nocardiopsis sediminis TaxID=1778267 RepID=A0ABV8FQ04_9ACTN
MTGDIGAPEFSVRVDQNRFLPLGGTDVHAVVEVAAAGVPDRRPRDGDGSDGLALVPTAPDAAEVVIIDTSASMRGEKIAAARRAAVAAVAALREGVLFAIVAGSGDAAMVYPGERRLVAATPRTRAAAARAVGGLAAGGGTRMGVWLRAAGELFAAPDTPALRHAILITDGLDNELPGGLDEALKEVAGRFVCDCRGVGTSWSVDELRRISSALMGGMGIIADPADMAADVRAMTEAAMGKTVADVALRLWIPQAAQVRFIRQVAPAVQDLRRIGRGPQVADYPLGAWGDEARDYHVCVAVPPGTPGRRMRAGWVRVVAGERVLASGDILAEWTADGDRSARIDARVAHYTGQTRLARAVREGLDARRRGDTDTATARLGRAVALAHAFGNEATAALLRKVVDVVDPETGTVRLRSSVAEVDEMTLDTDSTRTVRTRTADPAEG